MKADDALPLTTRLKLIRDRAREYFEASAPVVSTHGSQDHWTVLPQPLKNESAAIASELALLAQHVGPTIRHSPLLTEADEREAGHAIKGMRAALRFRGFEHWSAEILHDEGAILGIRPGGEADDYYLGASDARGIFDHWADTLQSRLELVNLQQGVSFDSVPTSLARPIAAGYRPGTAFIMMWLAEDRPELVDVSNTVKRCFAEFGIEGVRSDDIEHEDVITQRVLDEIKTAEFLFADLTGERPSVYYEVGYAHAIGRRVILFRKADTKIHFDLAAYNCPEYQNLTELETKLLKRLEYVTGRVPKKKL